MAAPTITDSVVATGTGTSVTTGALTIASGDVLYVGFILSDGSPGGVTSVTSSGGGGALSSLAESGVVQSYLRLHIWRSTSPTAGSVTITATPAASTTEMAVIAVSVAGVDSGTPNGSVVFANGNGTADGTSGTVSSGTDALVLDFVGRFLDGTFSMTAGGGQTILDQANYSGILSGGSSTKAGAASVTTTWSRNTMGTVSNWEWVIGALSINGATGGSPYTLTCDAGVFTLTGGTVGLKQGYVLPIGAGSFTLTGSDALRDLSMSLAAGSFTLTGQDITLTPSGTPAVLTAAAGSFALTGGAVGLRADRRLAALAGSFTLTGPDVTLTYTPAGANPVMTCDAGSFSLSGQVVSLAAARRLALAAGSFSLSGQAVTLTRSAARLAAEAGSYVIAGGERTVDYSGGLPGGGPLVIRARRRRRR